MRIIFSKEDTNGISGFAKVVVTTFLDTPSPGRVTCYIEVLTSQTGSFRITTSQHSEASLQAQPVDQCFYLDTVACKAHLKNFRSLGHGRHEQTVGENTYTVSPYSPNLFPVQNAFLVDFQQAPEGGEHHGAWLVLEKPTRVSPSGKPRDKVKLTLASEGLEIDNFYWWVVCPDEYRGGENGRYQVSEIGQPPSGGDPEDILGFLEINDDYPCFLEWQDIFRGRQVVRNKRSVKLKAEREVSIKFPVISERLAQRSVRRSYLAGVIIALVGSIAAQAAMRLAAAYSQEKTILWVIFAISVIMLSVAIWLGLRWTREV